MRTSTLHMQELPHTQKLIPYESLENWRTLMGYSHGVVVTNGCFDILHVGHVDFLERARRLGEILLVGLNSDKSVKQLKGMARPVNPQMHRAYVLSGLSCVSAVCIFDDKTATNFLRRARPNVYVKGGDYTLETLDQSERKVVEKEEGHIIFIPFSYNVATTQVIEKIRGL